MIIIVYFEFKDSGCDLKIRQRPDEIEWTDMNPVLSCFIITQMTKYYNNNIQNEIDNS